MIVEIKRNSYCSKYGFLTVNKEIDVDKKTGERWIRNGVAIEKNTEIEKLEEKTNKELLQMCIEKGIEAQKGKAKNYYISLLNND